MRRMVALVVVAVLAVVASTAVRPGEPSGPDFGTDTTLDAGDAVGRTSAWYCPWVDAGAVRDSVIGLASEVPVEALVSLPSPFPNEAPDTLPLTLRALDAVDLDIGSVVRRGESPAIVEFDDGPAAAGAVVWSDAVVTGDRCVTSVPKQWHLTGGSTATGLFVELRLFNPFAELAKVDITALSEFGSEPLPEYEGFDVAGRSWATIDLTTTLPLRDVLSVLVSTSQGLVIPSLVLAGDTDEASWPGSGPATTWEFPVTAAGELVPYLTISNADDSPVSVVIDVYGPDGSIEEATTVEVQASTPIRIPLAEIAAPPFGVRLRSGGPVAATVEALPPVVDEESVPPEDEEGGEVRPPIEGVAGTVGVRSPAERWLVPATGSLEDSVATIWVLNTGSTSATVAVEPLGPTGLEPDKVVVEAGTVVAVDVESGDDIEGYRVVGSAPVSVAVSIVDARGVAFLSAVPVR